MFEIISKTTISEVILLFLLLFILPMLALLVQRLRKYEALFGRLPEEERKGFFGRRKRKKAETDPEAAAAPIAEEGGGVFSYRTRSFMSPADRSCLGAMREALGPDVEVFPKVALWEVVEAADPAPANVQRVKGLDYDFLVCDRRTGQVLTGVMFKPGKGRPGGPVDELKRICQAAGANVVFIDMAEEYDVKKLKDALGIPDLDL